MTTGDQQRIFGATRIAYLAIVPLILTTGIYFLFIFLGRTIVFWELWIVLTGLWLCGLLITAVNRRTAQPPPLRSNFDSEAHVDRPFADVSRWDDRLSWSSKDLDRFDHNVRSRINSIVTTRVLQRHGINLATEPRRAADVLPPLLHAFMTTPPHRPATRDELEQLVHMIERI